jgi:hypothetical protein
MLEYFKKLNSIMDVKMHTKIVTERQQIESVGIEIPFHYS